jgi:hypothetical protein
MRGLAPGVFGARRGEDTMRDHGTGLERLASAWRRVLAMVFAAALLVAPVLAFAQGTGSGGGAPGGTPSSGAPGGPSDGGGGGGGFGWIVVLLAIAVAIWLFTRRRGGQAHR